MANYKRKRTRRCIRCTICTKYRWRGNSRARTPHADRRRNLAVSTED